MKISPPQVLSDYFTSANDGRIDDAAACFASDALVHDENHDHKGAEEIHAWIKDTTQKYHPKSEVSNIHSINDAFVATATVSGTFPGSPVQLQYTFTVHNDKITHLSIQ